MQKLFTMQIYLIMQKNVIMIQLDQKRLEMIIYLCMKIMAKYLQKDNLKIKDIFINRAEDGRDFNFRDILKPMDEDELKMIILDDEELEKKELETFVRQIEKNEQENSGQIKLEELKKPPT